MIVVTLNLKGGVGKTTTAVGLVNALRAAGSPTLLVDADPQGSALAWATEAGDESCVALPTTDLPKRVPKLLAGGEWQHAVIDTPPGDLRIVRSAVAASNIAVICLQPELTDIKRLQTTIDLVGDYPTAVATVLLTRFDSRRRLHSDAAGIITVALPEDVEMLEAVIPQRAAIAESEGTVMSTKAVLDPFHLLAVELGLTKGD